MLIALQEFSLFSIQMTHFRTDANFRSSFSVNWSKPMSHQIKCSKRIKLALIDLNGTCHIGNKLINQSNVAIRKLINSGVAVRYVTNTTKESTFSIAKRCKGTIYSIWMMKFRIFIKIFLFQIILKNIIKIKIFFYKIN